jgi:hypothetical protein
MPDPFRIAALLLLAAACGPPREDTNAARVLIRDIESNKSLIRYNHSACLAAVRGASSADESERRAREFPFCVAWREAETKRAEMEARLHELCARTREACERARDLERSGH